MKIPNWRQNLLRNGGFWQNGNWYDLHLDRRMPLAIPMMEELLSALPPLLENTRVCDLACGTGNTGFAVLASYPAAQLTLLDRDGDMLSIARSKILEIRETVEVIETDVAVDGGPLPGGPYDLVVASLALNDLVGHEIEAPEAEGRYELLFQGVFESLVSGGHLLVADHVGTLGLYRQLKAMERAGFADVDCAWRQDDFFVYGGRLPD